MKILMFALLCIEPAFLHQQHHLAQKLYCFSDEPLILLEKNGERSTATFAMINDNNYIPGASCNLTIAAANKQYLLVSFDVIDTRPCDQDTIEIETLNSNATLCGHHDCPQHNCPGYTFDNIPRISVHFKSNSYSKDPVKGVGFQGLITSYSLVDPNTNSCPDDGRFQCANKRCIWEDLQCDGNNNCGDNSDERPGCGKTVWGVLVIILGVACLCFFMPVFCYLAIRGPKHSVPIRIMGTTFFGPKETTSVNDVEAVPILLSQPMHGTMPGETFTFYYGATNNPRC